MATRRSVRTPSFDLDSLPVPAGDDDALEVKPIERAQAAKAPAVTRLADRLVQEFGQHPLAAHALARAVVDPATARNQLSSPNRERVPGATLLTITTQVWPAAICPSPVNPRPASTVQFPAGLGPNDPKPRRPLTSAQSESSGAPALELTVADPDHLVASLEASTTYLVAHNDLSSTVAQQGVLRPVLVAPCLVQHEDGSSAIAINQTSDGSSRTTATWGLWQIKPRDLYQLADARHLNRKIAEVTRLVDQPVDDLSADDLGLLRVQSIPATLIVGFMPDARANVTYAEAVEAMVAMIHVDPPLKWEPDADLDVKANAILEEFGELGVPKPLVQYLGGFLTPAEAVAIGLNPELDHRAAMLFRTLGDDKYKRTVNAGLRRLSARRTNPQRTTRLEPVVELMIRPYRATLGAADVKAARTSLHALVQLTEFSKTAWSVSGRAPEVLLAEALKVHKKAQVGPACVELAFYGLFWLTRHKGLQRVVDRSNPDDTREPGELLRTLLQTDHGLRVLAQAIADGRAGMRPRAVNKTGKVQNKADGTPVYVDSQWIRGQFPISKKKGAPAPSDGSEAPEARLLRHVGALGDAIDDLVAAEKALARIKGSDGKLLVKTNGIPTDVANEQADKLDALAQRLRGHGTVFDIKHGSDDDDDEDDEGEG